MLLAGSRMPPSIKLSLSYHEDWSECNGRLKDVDFTVEALDYQPSSVIGWTLILTSMSVSLALFLLSG